MKKIIKIIILTCIISIPLLGIGKYIHAITIGKDSTDCMVKYIRNYYPNGSVYLIDNKFPHIDERGLEYMKEIKEINGCLITDSIRSFIFNSTYCYITLAIENSLQKLTQ